MSRGKTRGGGGREGGGKARPKRGKPATGNARERDGIWLFGLHAVRAALQNPARRFLTLRATRNAAADLAPLAKTCGVSIEDTHPADLDTLLPPGTVHQGVALLAEPLLPPALEDAVETAGAASTILVLDQVTDPHNVGAILRSAAVFGVDFVVAPTRHAPPESGTLAKSASGALETVPVVRVGNLVQALDILKQAGYWLVGLDGSAAEDLGTLQPAGKLALVLGSEGKGLRRLTAESCDRLARIAMAENAVGSLNVSNAAAVALYDVTTRR